MIASTIENRSSHIGYVPTRRIDNYAIPRVDERPIILLATRVRKVKLQPVQIAVFLMDNGLARTLITIYR